MTVKILRELPFKSFVQTYVVVCVSALITQGCSLFHLDNDSRDTDAGDAAIQGGSNCSPNSRVCFSSPKVTTTSWGITSVLARNPQSVTSRPTLIVTAHGSSELIELKPASDNLVVLSQCKTATAPWQAVLGDFDLDGKDDLAVASPGTTIQSGDVSFWRAGSSWSEVTSLSVGVATYAVAIRSGATAGSIVAAGASYAAQTLLPFIAKAGGSPTVGTSNAIDMKPTAMLFGSGSSASQLYVIGHGSTQGRLVVYNASGGSLSEVARSEPFGTSLNDLKLGDVNADSILDAVIIDDSDDSAVYTLTGDPNHHWTIAARRALPANSHALTLDDFDGDGKLDVATISGSTSTVQLCFGDGHGAFGNCELVPHGVEQPTDVTSKDLDADHRLDVVVVGYDGQVSIIYSRPLLQ